MSKQFTFTLNMSATLTTQQIWPDGDAPEAPTALQVIQVMQGQSNGLLQALEEWGLEDAIQLTVNLVGNPKDRAHW